MKKKTIFFEYELRTLMPHCFRGSINLELEEIERQFEILYPYKYVTTARYLLGGTEKIHKLNEDGKRI